MKHLLFAALFLLAAAVFAGAARAEEKVLNIYNWTDYIDPAALEKFTAETGIKVRYDEFDSLETLEAKLLAGNSGYDIVVPSNEPTFSRLIHAGALAEIDRSHVPNWKNLDPGLMRRVESSDPGNKHGAIYLWGTTGLGVLPDKIEALVPNAPLDSWDLLFKPENAKRLAACGITMMDSAIDTIPSVLKFLGRDPDSNAPDDLAAAEHALMAIRPYVRSFASGGALDALATGQTCLVFDYSGDVAQAASRAADARPRIAVRYIVPKEGAEVGFDMLAIPADAPHKEAALAFIDFVLRPSVMAGITNVTHYPNAVPASRPMVEDGSVFPSDAEMARYFTIGSIPQSAERARTRLWARFKAGG
jgi:putrescine transport system substrate-binding protein